MSDTQFKKGKKPGPGRPKGVLNKHTVNAREAIARLVDGNVHRMEGWLDEIAKEQGAMAAYRCLMDVIEFHVPKLARTELTGKDGAELTVNLGDKFKKVT